MSARLGAMPFAYPIGSQLYHPNLSRRRPLRWTEMIRHPRSPDSGLDRRLSRRPHERG